MFGVVRDLLNKAFRKNTNLRQDLVLYAGLDDNIQSNAFKFGIYQFCEGEYFWLPATATDPEVIRKLKTLQIGQKFYITNEEALGGLGCLVKSIEIPNAVPSIDVPSDVPGFFKANNP